MEVKIKRSFWTGKYKGMEVKGEAYELDEFPMRKNSIETYMLENGIDKLSGDGRAIMHGISGRYVW